LNDEAAGLAASYLIVPRSPLNVPLVPIPKFLIEKLTASSASTGFKSVNLKDTRGINMKSNKNDFMG